MIAIKKTGTRSRQLVCGQEKNGPKLAFLKNMNAFVREFNSKTQNESGKIVTVKIITFNDGTFNYKITNTPSSIILKELINSKREITKKSIDELAQKLLEISNTKDLSKIKKIIDGTMKSANIKMIE